MSYVVTRVVARATNRSYVLTHAVGRTTTDRSYRVTKVVGRATATPVAGGTWKVTRVRGRAGTTTPPSGPVVEPFDVVQLADGVWTQTAGPTVLLSSSGQFVAPALSGGADVSFVSGSTSVSIHVNPHTVFARKATVSDPLYVSPNSEPRPFVT